jgi:hypothetical protein
LRPDRYTILVKPHGHVVLAHRAHLGTKAI